MNPYRDPAIIVELGERARDALMTSADWDELLTLWTTQNRLDAR
jgi:hypothetical protein